MILIPILLGIILRIYKIGTNYYFTGELGKELLYMRLFSLNHSLPLVGMPTSHEWLNYGPIYYWVMIPLFNLFKGDPFLLFWVALVVSVIGVYLIYWVFSKVVNKKFALILAFFISLSPILVLMSRLSKLHVFFFILVPLIIYYLYRFWNNDRTKIFWLGLTFGLLFSVHFSQIPLLTVIALAFWIKRKFFKVKDYLLFIVGVILPNITILIYDAGRGFAMTKGFFLWIPYRIAGFLGIYPINNLDLVFGGSTLSAFNEFFGRNFFWDSRIWVLGSVIFFLLFITFAVQNRKKAFKDFFVFYLVFSTAAQCLALLIHTSPPLHYFLPIFLNFGLLFSYFACEYWQRPLTKVLTSLIFALMFVSGILALGREHIGDLDYVPFSDQENAVRYMMAESKGLAFRIVRVGPYDYFPEQYSQNYKYLVLWMGGNLSDSSANVYTVVEDNGKINVQK